MSTLQPLQALNLDSVKQQAFIKYFNLLPEKPPTTVRIFDRNEYYSVHGEDATTAAREVFSSLSNIKKMGIEPNKLDYLVLSKGNFEILIRKLLLVRRYRVEIYVCDGPNEWVLKYKASPGYLSPLEDALAEITNSDNGCLMAVYIKTDPVSKARIVGISCIYAHEYELRSCEVSDDELLTQLEGIVAQCAPAECLVPQVDNDDYKTLKKVMDRANVTLTKLKKVDFSTEGLIQDLNRLLKFKDSQIQDANSFPETRLNVAMMSLSATIRYTSLITDSTNYGRFRLTTIKSTGYLHLDSSALSALNVLPTPGDTTPQRSLYGLLDRCRTQHGKRLLAQWLRQPLRDINLINERLDIVQVLVDNSQLRLQLHEEHLRRIPDLQALARKLTKKKANLHDCYRIYQAIHRLPSLLQCIGQAENATVHSALAEPISELNDDLHKYQLCMEATLDMDAVDRGDFLVKPSFDEQLQVLYDEIEKLQSSADKELNKAGRDLGLEPKKTIKLECNPQNGFNFRVTLKEEHSLRGNKKYTIIDAVKGGVRFKTTALEHINEEYIQAKANYEKEQDKVVAQIIEIAAGYAECLMCLSHILSRLDVLVAFSICAVTAPTAYNRPVLTESAHELILTACRHPCVEVQEGVSYIPNDVVFNRDSRIMHIVTGANMGGKSTWMRSCGISVLLAHAGCFVPAEYAKVPLMTSLCARVGASDREEKGQSTFMLEMIETAAILRTATPDSLVLVDELGRGTSTYEGCGIAWAIAEKLATESKCFCLFATHYHELTRLPSIHPLIVNSHAEANVIDGELVLSHRIVQGPATHSLGIHVAKLADLPDTIIKYAEAKQAQLETNLFEVEAAVNTEETAEGLKLIQDFLKKCKQLQENNIPDEDFNKEIKKIKQDLLKSNSKYVKALLNVCE